MTEQLPEIVKPKLDIIFKRIFGDKRNKNIIIRFLADILEIPHNSIKEIYIENGELIPEYSEEKFSRLDIKLELKDVNDSENQIINIEMQVNSEPAFKERTLFYWSKIYSEELKSSEEYDYLKKTICINIINFNLFTSPEYQSHFQILEKDRKELLTDKFSIYFFELRKLKKSQKGKPVEDWLNLINAEKKEDLMALEMSTKIPEVKDVIVKVRELSSDEKLRRLAFYREKRLHDEANAINGSRREGIKIGRAEGEKIGRVEGEKIGRAEGKLEIAKNMILENLPFDLISRATKLNISEIESLASSLSLNCKLDNK